MSTETEPSERPFSHGEVILQRKAADLTEEVKTHASRLAAAKIIIAETEPRLELTESRLAEVIEDLTTLGRINGERL